MPRTIIVVFAATLLGAPAYADDALAPLPQREVALPPVHTVHEEDGAASAPRRLDVTKPPAGLAADPSPARRSVTAKAYPTPVAGWAEVEDATTLALNGRRVRLFGIAVPPAGERCAKADCRGRASTLLRQAVASGIVSCSFPSRAGGGVCRNAAGLDLAGFLVAEGVARADPRQSYDYVRQEEKARAARRGLWQYR